MISLASLDNNIVITTSEGLIVDNIDNLLSLSYKNILSCKYCKTNKDKLIDNGILQYVNTGYLGGMEFDLSSVYNFKSQYDFVLNYKVFNKPNYLPEKSLENCDTLTAIFKIPSHYKKIGKYAFSGCDKLSIVNLHKNISILGEGAFYGCASLKEINIFDITTIYKYGLSGTKISSIDLNPSIDYIPSYFFKDCINLKKFENEDIKYLGVGAFSGCSSLTSVIVNYLGEYIDPINEIFPEEDPDEPDDNGSDDNGDNGDDNGSDDNGGNNGDNGDDNGSDDIDDNGDDNGSDDNGDEPDGPDPKVDPGVYIIYDKTTNIRLFSLDDVEGKNLRDLLLENGIIELYDDENKNYWKYNYIDDITFVVYDKNKEQILYTSNNFRQIENYAIVDGQLNINEIINFPDMPSFHEENGITDYNTFDYTLNCYEVWSETSPGPIYYIFDSIEYNGNNYNFLSNRLSKDPYFELDSRETNYERYIDRRYTVVNGANGSEYPCYEIGWHKFGISSTISTNDIEYASETYVHQYHSIFISIPPVYWIRENNDPNATSDIYCYMNIYTEINPDNIDTNNSTNNITMANNGAYDRIPDYLFNGCTLLTENNISFISNIKNVGESSFGYCRSLYRLNNKFISISNNGFKNCSNLSIVDLSECTSIGNYAFKDCINLIGNLNPLTNEFEIDLSKITQTDSKGVFENCKSLKYIKLNDSINKINESFFKGCMKLENLALSKINEVKDYGLYDCQKLTVGTNTNIHNITKFGQYSFANCTSLDNLIFNNSVKFSEGVFSNCINIKKININKIKDNTIPKNLFYNCARLEEIVINDMVNTFDLTALSKCDMLEKIHIENNNGRFVTYNDKCIIDRGENRDKCKIVYVCKNIDTFELNDSICDTPAIVEIDNNAFNYSKVSLINLKLVPNIKSNVFKKISNNTYHVLLDKSHAYYNDYYSIVGKNHIYYI